MPDSTEPTWEVYNVDSLKTCRTGDGDPLVFTDYDEALSTCRAFNRWSRQVDMRRVWN